MNYTIDEMTSIMDSYKNGSSILTKNKELEHWNLCKSGLNWNWNIMDYKVYTDPSTLVLTEIDGLDYATLATETGKDADTLKSECHTLAESILKNVSLNSDITDTSDNFIIRIKDVDNDNAMIWVSYYIKTTSKTISLR